MTTKPYRHVLYQRYATLLSTLGLIFAILEFAKANYQLAAILGGLALAGYGTVALNRMMPESSMPAHLLCGIGLLVMGVVRLRLGVGGPPFWVIIIPVFAAVLVDGRAAVIWGLLSSAFLVVLHQQMNYPPELQSGSMLFSLMALLWVTTALIVGLLRSNDLSVRNLDVARREAQEANAAKSRFLARVSHELRTPMTGIMGLTEALTDSELGPTQRMYVETLQQTQTSLIHIINDIIDLSQVEAGHLQIQPRAFELPSLVEQVDRLYAARAFKEELNWKCHVDPDVHRWVRGDPGRIRQILHNLLNNAFKFTDTGGIHLRVAVANEGSETITLLFEVGDTGPGVPVNEQRSLFTEFSQLDPAASGSGLGLAISKKLVDAMGGRIGLDSEAGQGSRFWFEVTLDRSTEPSVQLAPALTQEVPALRPMEILLAEDHFLTQKVARIMLEGLGCSVIIASNGTEAVELLRERAFDLVLMDCHMPEMDGFEATARMREMMPGSNRPPIVALTADAVKGDRERCLAAGMDDYLAKPFTRDQLMGILTRWSPT